MRGKIGVDKSSRGYCGWHTTWCGQTVYLRSKVEYIVARLLDFHRIDYLTECKIYEIDGIKYKPDFFIFNKNKKLIRIIEVKYTNNEKIDYLKKFKTFFNNIDISYIILTKYHTKIIQKKYNLKDEINDWCLTSATIQHDMKGVKNPHYGMTHTICTKEKIGLKTKERFSTKQFKQKHHISMKNWMDDERKKYLSKIKTGVPTRLVDKHEIKTKCLFCGCDVDSVEWYRDNVLMKEEIKKFCSKSCSCKYTRQNEINIKKEKQIHLIIDYVTIYKKYPNRIQFHGYCKENNIPCDIRSTFGTHTKFIKYMEDLNG